MTGSFSGAAMASDNSTAHRIQVFNTPLEAGIRSAALLVSAYPTACDLQRLVQYDYLIVHSGDVDGGPPSIHPATPHRSSELLVRRRLIEAGLDLMAARAVVDRAFGERGITYVAGEYAVPFLDSLTTEYIFALRDRAEWVIATFRGMGEEQLNSFMRGRWSQWGSEFVRRTFSEADEE
jgi:ABC-three component (ABC-3C) system Middle Component 2